MTAEHRHSNDTDLGNGIGEYNRPRRPSPDTVSYLRSLPLDWSVAKAELDTFFECNNSNNTDDTQDSAIRRNAEDFPSTLAVALQALYEVRHELASLAGDEQCSEIIELLCRIALPLSSTATALVLQAIYPYTLHLATHRYGSHVLQTVISVSASSTYSASDNPLGTNTKRRTNVDLAWHVNAPSAPTDIHRITSTSNESTNTNESPAAAAAVVDDWILRVAADWTECATDLARHICASHVLRTLLCRLGGVQQKQQQHGTINNTTLTNGMENLSQRRGKTKTKKKHKKGGAESIRTDRSSSSEYRLVYHPTTVSFNDDTGNLQREALLRLTTALTVPQSQQQQQPTIGPGDVQRWACHSSAGPVLSLLLQIWTYLEPDKGTLEEWRDRQGKWDAATSAADRHLCFARPEPRYRMNSTAYTIVQRILCWTSPTAQEQFGATVIYGLAGEPRGSHCLEAILRWSPDVVYTDLLRLGNWTDAATLQEYIRDNDTVETNNGDEDSGGGGGAPGVCNFVIQTLLQTLRDATQAQAVLHALEPSLPYVLDPQKRRRGILWRMAEMAVSFPDCQATILHMLPQACATANTTDSRPHQKVSAAAENKTVVKLNKCLPFLLNIQLPIEQQQHGDRLQLDVAGTRAVYHMLRFDPSLCKDTIKGLMELEPAQIEGLAKDPLGSRCILDGILDGPIHDEVFRLALKRLLTKLLGRWVAVAVDRVGHHVVKKLFRGLRDVEDKLTLVNEMVEGKNRMVGNSMGRSVLDALEVRVFEVKGEAEWSKVINTSNKNEEWLEELVGSDDKAKDLSTKRKKSKDGHAKVLPKKGRLSQSVDAIVDAMTIPDGKNS